MSQEHLSKNPAPNQEKNLASDDYISLSGVKGLLAQLLRFFIRVIDFFIAILFRNKLLLLTGLVIGLGIGYFYYISKKNAYKLSMIVEFTELSKKTFAEMFSQLNTLILTGSHEQLAQELQVSLPVAKNIGFIETFNINNEPLFKDTSTKINQTFKVLVHVNNNNMADTLQAAFIRYLNDNPYLYRIKESQKKIYQQKIAFIDSELAKLDSLKTEYNKFLATSKVSATIYNNAFNPAEIYMQSNNLMNQKENTMRWLELNASAVNVVAGFKTPARPLSSSLLKWLVIFGLGGLLIAFLIGIFREMKRMLIG